MDNTKNLNEENDDYELEYSDSEDSSSEPDILLENQYYMAKTIKDDNRERSLLAFNKVLEIQGDNNRTIWGFKALKQMVKIYFQFKNYQETINRYKELLTYINTIVTKNHAEKSINSILDYTSISDDDNNMEILKIFYETTLDALKTIKNERLWFKTNIKLGRIYLKRGEFNKLTIIIRQLKQACRCGDNIDESNHNHYNKGAQLLEIYALEIQMYTELKNHQQLKRIYQKSLKIRSIIPHPIIMSIIKECGGKMYLRSGDYERAYTDFFEAFRNYDESGNPRRLTCLKYLLLTSMLMKSAINPFDSQEAKPYMNEPEIQAMKALIDSYQDNNMLEFERIFQQNKTTLIDDHFIKEHITNLLMNFRTKILLTLIQPYRNIKIEFIANELGISNGEAEDLIVSCILDRLIDGRIDQLNGVVMMMRPSKSLNRIYEAMEKLAGKINNLTLCF